MNSRERILNTLTGKPCDRVPVSTYELVGYNSDAFENKQPSYARLMDFIREKTDCFYMTHFNTKMGAATTSVRENRKWREGASEFTESVFRTPLGEIKKLQREDDDVATVWTLQHLLKEVEDIDRYLSIPFEVEEVAVRDVEKAVQRLAGVHGIPLISLADPIGEAAGLFDFSTFLVYSVMEREKIKYFLDAIHERQMHVLRMGLESLKAVGEKCIFRTCGPEYATPPYLSEVYFADFVFPYIRDITELIHKYGHFSRIHSHGKVRKALEYIVRAGADATDPIEPPPDGDITLDEAKRLFGRDLVLFGNIELKLLEAGKTEDVVDYVKDMVLTGKSGGNFVAMPTAAPIDVPLKPLTEQNYIAFIETALEYGGL